MERFEIITGRAGTGKTSALFSRIAALRAAGDGAECFVIVPEQATFETERGLASALGGGLFSCTVTSWKGMARKLLDSVGVRRAFLSGEGRVMLVRRSADETAKDLTAFKKSAEYRGFPKECDTLIAKFKRCGMGAEDVKRAAEGLEEGDPLRMKLSDISLIFAELERRCADRYLDSEDVLRELVSHMGETALRGAHIFIDGGDTVHEYVYPIFAVLLDNAASVTLALTLDAYSPDRELFSEELFVLEKLRAIAEERGVRAEITRLSERKRGGSEALRHLERELFSPSPRVFSGVPEGLSVYMAASRADEVAEAAERIRNAAKRGVSYRDMAVIVSDLSGYAPYFRRIFPAYGIPYFTDAKRRLLTHPAARLVLSALTAVEKGYDAAYVIETVKTGYFDITPDEAELFENFLLKTGISGRRLTEPFTDEGAELEPVRERIMAPLTALHAELADRSSESRARAIHSFMEALDLYKKQTELCARLHGESRFREEEENAQVVNTILEVLDQLFVIMGGEAIGMKRFISVVREGFEAYEVGAIPTTCDQVLVGSMERTRTREERLLIVLGMNDGLFPAPRKDEGVIDDADLKKLEARGFELWKSTGRLSSGDRFLIYQSLSKASEELVFSYPVSIAGAGAMDRAAVPCRLLQTVKRIFPLIPCFDGVFAPRERSSAELSLLSLSRSLRRVIDTGTDDPEAAEYAAWFRKEPAYRAFFERLTLDCFGQREAPPLGAELAGKLYGRTLYGSASRLESFNGCPFRHFMQYGLSAKEREERKEKNTDLGSFYHEALEAYVRYVMDNRLDWKGIDDEKTFEILREIIPPIMYRRGGRLLYDTARQRARLNNVVETVRFTCCAVTRQIARGSFRPKGCEVSFGRAESLFPPLRVEAGDAVFYISGIIDRLDASGDMTRIIDYKSGGKEFDFGELFAGLQLQLPLYAAAVSAADAVSVGMYYMPIRDVDPVGDETGEARKELTDELLKDFRLSGVTLREAEVLDASEGPDSRSTVLRVRYNKEGAVTGSGLVSADELKLAVGFAEKKAASTLESILCGEIAVSPTHTVKGDRLACKYCVYKDVCLFDPELSRSGARDVYPMSADGFFGR